MKCFALFLLSAILVSAADFTNGQAAWAVVGQSTFAAQNGTASQTTLGSVGGLAWAGGKLFVADSSRVGASINPSGGNPQNNRVLIFNAAGTGGIPDPRSSVETTGNTQNSRCPVCGFPASLVLGQSDFTATSLASVSASSLRTPTAVASDGTYVAVADTDNNRVLIWNSIPGSNGQAANVVLGQPDFQTVQKFAGVRNNSLRGPQGVWIQNGKLFVADTQNHRVLIWNSIPTQNGQAADVVLGQKDFTSSQQPDPQQTTVTAAANRLFSPVSVTSDGVHLFVTDLGFNRVLIWNTIPASVDAPADIVVGQPDMQAAVANNSSAVCASNGTDSNNNPRFPSRCERTLNFPRYALADNKGRFFIADGGNDRVLVFNSIPSTNGAAADHVLGQPDFQSDLVSDPSSTFASTVVPNRASTDTMRTPLSLASDGVNLYVADPFDLRVLVFTPGDNQLPDRAILNAASLAIFQEGVVALSGSINANDTVSITIGNTPNGTTNTYTYTVQKTDTLATVAQGLVSKINEKNGDPNVIALVGNPSDTILLNSRRSELPNDTISLSVANSTGAQIKATASGSFLSGGTSSTIAPGTIVAISGTNLTDGGTAEASGDTTGTPGNGAPLPTTLAGAQVYVDGNPTPLLYASPTLIRAQVPYTISDSNSASVYVRTTTKSSGAQITNATGIIVAPANPGIFAFPGQEPRPGMVLHGSSQATVVVSIDGTVKAGDTATITVNGRPYTYTVQASDSVYSIRDALIAQINKAPDPQVRATTGGQFARVVLTAIAPGASGNGIPVKASASTGAKVILTAYSSATCCANTAGAPVTAGNPAVAGETLLVYTTGLGLLSLAPGVPEPVAGKPWTGPVPNTVTSSVSATVSGLTAQVVDAMLPANGIGVYQVHILLPAGLPANNNTQLYLAQDAFLSNIVTFPVGGAQSAVTFTANPNPIVMSSGYGQTTITWNAPGVGGIEVHLNSPTGPLFASGGSSGTATTGPWVQDGTTFYLQDVSNGRALDASGTLATLVIRLGTPQSLTSFTMNPNPIPVGIGQSDGTATLSWTAPTATKVEIHLGSPTGPLFAAGGNSGSATTGAWVSDGTVFYLQDVTNGLPLTSQNTLAKLVAHLATAQSLTTLTASPNPIPLANGQSYGVTTLSWNAPESTHVEIHVGSPSGPLFAAGGSLGSATTGAWVSDGEVFYLQDVSNGNPLNSENTLKTVTVSAKSASALTSLTASPNPIPVSSATAFGQTTIDWSAPSATSVEVHVDSPNGPLFAAGGPTGSALTGVWVVNGTVFYLQDVSNGHALNASGTLAQLTINLQHP